MAENNETVSTISDENKPIDQSDILQDRAFQGEYTIDGIRESIINQANDYVNLEDTKDYVTIFFTQYHTSCDAALLRDDLYRETALEYLHGLHDGFIDFLNELFRKRLNIAINEDHLKENNEYDMEWVLGQVYQFFILDARKNFKTCISFDVISRMPNRNELDDREYFATVQDLMKLYTPLLTMTPTDFLKYRGDEEMIRFFDQGVVSGNFLTKYSPKLYANDEFQVEIINHITMIDSMEEETNNGQNGIDQREDGGTE